MTAAIGTKVLPHGDLEASMFLTDMAPETSSMSRMGRGQYEIGLGERLEALVVPAQDGKVHPARRVLPPQYVGDLAAKIERAWHPLLAASRARQVRTVMRVPWHEGVNAIATPCPM